MCVRPPNSPARFGLGRVEIAAVDEEHGRFGQRHELEGGGQRGGNVRAFGLRRRCWFRSSPGSAEA
jgi:hypothetical protein